MTVAIRNVKDFKSVPRLPSVNPLGAQAGWETPEGSSPFPLKASNQISHD